MMDNEAVRSSAIQLQRIIDHNTEELAKLLKMWGEENCPHKIGNIIPLEGGPTKVGRVIDVTGELDDENVLHYVVQVKPVKADGTDSWRYARWKWIKA